MKKVLMLVMALLCSSLLSAQSFQEAYQSTREIQPFANANGTQSYNALTGNSGEWSKIMGVFFDFDDINLGKKGIEGSVFLYDNWKNNGQIFLGERKFTVSNINYHISRGSFMTKIENDSIFIFDFDLVDKIKVNNTSFKRLYNPKEGKHVVYEFIYEGQNFSLLKNYKLSVVEGSPNPMVNRPKSKIKQHSSYYLLKNKVISDFQLKKSAVLGLVEGDKVAALKERADKYNLSFKKEEDVVKLLQAIK